MAQQVFNQGSYLLDKLRDLASRHVGLIRQVRGLGLLTAIELVDETNLLPLTQACLERGLLVTPTRNGVVRLIPSLLVTTEEIDEASTVLQHVLQDLNARVAAAS